MSLDCNKIEENPLWIKAGMNKPLFLNLALSLPMCHQTHQIMIQTCIDYLQKTFRQVYGDQNRKGLETMVEFADYALHQIAQTDAPYHNLEHTILVTLAGQAILRGKHLSGCHVSCKDWLHSIISLLCHDIGLVKGICRQDSLPNHLYATGINGEFIQLPPNATDASLTPYHIDRGKLLVQEYFQNHDLIDISLLQQHIELTRFPVPNDAEHQDTIGYSGLVRAADLIGQLADPNYLKKILFLFQEFEETGINEQFGYHQPHDIQRAYPNFFRNIVTPYIQTGLNYLTVTPEGKKLIHYLYKNVELAQVDSKEQSVFTAPISSCQSFLNRSDSNRNLAPYCPPCDLEWLVTG